MTSDHGQPIPFPLEGRRVWVAGHRGMVGSALVRRLGAAGADVLTVGRDHLDLSDQAAVRDWLADVRPDAVVVAAAKVGGIHANASLPADFLHDNLVIAANIIHGAHLADVRKLLFLGSSCAYPRQAAQPIAEDQLLTGPLEPTNEWYAVAKIAGIKLCQAYRRQHGRDFIALMPTNLYGPGDNYHPLHSHVPAALIRRFHEAKEAAVDRVAIWGTGAPLREFLYVDDLADACAFALERYSGEMFLNVGSGEETTIAAFARLVADVVGFRGLVTFDTSKPDGMPRKLLDSSRLTALGWRPRTPLRAGLRMAYADFLAGGGRFRDGDGGRSACLPPPSPCATREGRGRDRDGPRDGA
ncbi:GDP-L-fucose synthase family protein [Azospirillum sp. ST 5-10]|uniref:GDP-L-fucose synthase family protein n=1 Tax=unclassified Azospirillum TaxID=2630922 RepID=UPI003F4A0A17